MMTLGINTASSKTAIVLLADGKSIDVQGPQLRIIAEESWQAHNDEAQKLLPAIAELLQKTGKKFPDIQQIIVVKGPGSFTGLRVGITVANTLAYLNWHTQSGAEYSPEMDPPQYENIADDIFAKTLLTGISTFEYWHAAAKLPLLVYAGSGGVYLSIGPEKTAELINLDELYGILKKRKITKVFGDISAEQKKALKEIEFVEISETFGQIIAKCLAEIYRTKRRPEKIVEPLYIKQPGVTSRAQNCAAGT